jgi:hypothetical protein
MRTTFVRAALAAALFGAVLAQAVPAQDLPAITRKDLTTSQNNLKQIGLAFHNFHDATGGFPNDITGKDGKPLLSWRVAILPFIEQDDLYRQFKLDEPWDSDANKKLVEKMPKTYAPVRVQAKAGETYYQVFTGEKALFGGKVKNPRITGITDGTSNTGMVFEAGEPTAWTKPGDLPFDPKKELPKLGGLFDGDFHVVLCDGSVRRIKKGADEKELRKLIMPADGEVIDFSKIEK